MTLKKILAESAIPTHITSPTSMTPSQSGLNRAASKPSSPSRPDDPFLQLPALRIINTYCSTKFHSEGTTIEQVAKDIFDLVLDKDIIALFSDTNATPSSFEKLKSRLNALFINLTLTAILHLMDNNSTSARPMAANFHDAITEYNSAKNSDKKTDGNEPELKGPFTQVYKLSLQLNEAYCNLGTEQGLSGKQAELFSLSTKTMNYSGMEECLLFLFSFYDPSSDGCLTANRFVETTYQFYPAPQGNRHLLNLTRNKSHGAIYHTNAYASPHASPEAALAALKGDTSELRTFYAAAPPEVLSNTMVLGNLDDSTLDRNKGITIGPTCVSLLTSYIGPGELYKTINQDRSFSVGNMMGTPFDALGVVDGAGGHANSSQIATAASIYLTWYFSKFPLDPVFQNCPEADLPKLKTAVQHYLNQALHHCNVYINNPATPSQGVTTISVSLVIKHAENKRLVCFAQLGDSNLVLYKQDSHLTPILYTDDESFVLHSKLPAEHPNYQANPAITPADSNESFEKSLVKYLDTRHQISTFLATAEHLKRVGVEPFQFSIKFAEIEDAPNTTYFVMGQTDGVTDNLSLVEQTKLIQSSQKTEPASSNPDEAAPDEVASSKPASINLVRACSHLHRAIQFCQVHMALNELKSFYDNCVSHCDECMKKNTIPFTNLFYNNFRQQSKYASDKPYLSFMGEYPPKLIDVEKMFTEYKALYAKYESCKLPTEEEQKKQYQGELSELHQKLKQSNAANLATLADWIARGKQFLDKAYSESERDTFKKAGMHVPIPPKECVNYPANHPFALPPKFDNVTLSTQLIVFPKVKS